MIKKIALATVLLTQFVFADSAPAHEEPLEQGISYFYPSPNDDADPFSYKDTQAPASKNTPLKSNESKVGNVTFSAEAKEEDIYSQWRSEWKNQDKPKKSTPYPEDGSTHDVNFSMKWSED